MPNSRWTLLQHDTDHLGLKSWRGCCQSLKLLHCIWPISATSSLIWSLTCFFKGITPHKHKVTKIFCHYPFARCCRNTDNCNLEIQLHLQKLIPLIIFSQYMIIFSNDFSLLAYCEDLCLRTNAFVACPFTLFATVYRLAVSKMLKCCSVYSKILWRILLYLHIADKLQYKYSNIKKKKKERRRKEKKTD